MKEIKRVMYLKNGKNWKEGTTTTDQAEIYRSLANDMKAKFLHKCKYITRIADQCNYDGTRNITVYYDNNCKSVYTVEQ